MRSSPALTSGTEQNPDEGARAPVVSRIHWSETHRIGALLLVILVTVCFLLAAPDDEWSRFVIIVLQAATLLLALRVGRASARLTRIAFVVAGVVVAAAGVVLLSALHVSASLPRLLGLALVLLAPPAIVNGIVHDVRESGGVTLQTMFGALSIYLVLGVAFSLAFSIVDSAGSEPFFTSGGAPQTSDFLYFSFVTLTTLGYGDLAPATDVGRASAIAEALIGQLYLVTIIALVVSNLASRGRERAQEKRRRGA